MLDFPSGIFKLALKYYLEAMRLTFKTRNIESLIRGDLISYRSAALMLRRQGQKSRTLQLLTRFVKK